MSRRCLVLVSTTSYRTEAFVAAARRLGVEVVLGSDRCHELAQVFSDDAYAARGGYAGSLALDFRDLDAAAAQVVAAAAREPVDGIVATDDHTSVLAALSLRALGRPGNSPDATEAARNKSRLRERLHAHGIPGPVYAVLDADAPLEEFARVVLDTGGPGFPCVVKPLLLSAGRGVIRADDPDELGRAVERVRRILRTRPEHADGLPDARRVLIESFIPGPEVALEGLLRAGALRTLALFDKPDPLDGPCFEETLYVTPSRLPASVQSRIERAVLVAAQALGLTQGPVHAELRLRGDLAGEYEPIVIEVAARSIGGLCARTLRFALGSEEDHGLEELVLRQALGLDEGALASVGEAAGVMMLPIARAGVLVAMHGVEAAKEVDGIEDVVITARQGEKLVPLPEGGSYLGFVFARGADAGRVEAALREAYSRLRLEVAAVL